MSEKEQILQPLNKNFKEPKLRFKEFTISWKKVLFMDLFSISSFKNKNFEYLKVLSANQQLGMMPRDEGGIDIQFDIAKINTYKIIHAGDYVIHLRSFQGGFAFSKYDGICSPAYIILTPNHNLLVYSFFEEYFKSKKFIKSLKNVTFGLRDGKNIDVEKWMGSYTYIPNINEQIKIIRLLSILNQKINLLEEKISILKKYKKGLQKRIFITGNFSKKTLLKDIVKFERKSNIPAGNSIEDGIYVLYKSGQKNGFINHFTHDGIYIIANDGGEASFKLTNGKFAYTDHCICFKCENNEKTITLFNYLQMLEKKINYVGFIGTGLKNIDRQYLNSVKIPEINFEHIAHLFSNMDKIIDAKINELGRLKLIKAQLLKDLFL